MTTLICHQPMILMARMFAAGAHAAIGQLRKYTCEPYIVHPEEVARIVSSVQHTPEMVMAAYLHDVVEDTDVSFNDIEDNFGPKVCSLVIELTDTSRPEDGNRAARKAIDRERLAKASPGAQTIKLADLISNTASIVQHDLNFARVYLAEKEQLLEVLTKGDPALQAQARQQLREAQSEIMRGTLR